MSNTTRFLIAAAIIIVVALSFGSGYFVRAQIPNQYPAGLDKIVEVWDHITKEYVDPSAGDTGNLGEAAIEGMLEALDDPYSAYFTKSTYEHYYEAFQGNYQGIGAYVTMSGDNITVMSTIPGSPAEAAGLQPNDIIL